MSRKDDYSEDSPIHVHILEAVEKVHEKLDNIEKIQVEQASDIKHHIRRTDLLEERVEIVSKEQGKLKDTYQQFIGIGKFLAAIGAVLAAIKGLPSLFSFWHF